MMSGGGHDELIGWIARKRWRQSTALDEYRPRQLRQVQALHGGRHVEPFVEWPIELELMLLGLPGELPQRYQREPEGLLLLTLPDGGSGSG